MMLNMFHREVRRSTMSQEEAMKRRSLVAAAHLGGILLLGVGITAEAAELKVLSAFGMQSVLEDLGPPFERATGHTLAISFATGGATVKRAQGGEAADVVITLRPGIDTLVKDGKASTGSMTEVARAGIAVAVRQGAPKPDVSSPDALTRTLLAAQSISYVDPVSGGASGIHFAKVLDRLGIASEMHAKTVFPDPKTPAAVGVVVANGDAELGVHIIQELMPVAGIEIVGPLPGDLQHTIVFAAAVMASAKDAEAAKALVEFLRTPASAQVIEAKGMEPATP
jgi:molybdate transport system substrate-binding protein